jgi:hypothetical protein
VIEMTALQIFFFAGLPCLIAVISVLVGERFRSQQMAAGRRLKARQALKVRLEHLLPTTIGTLRRTHGPGFAPGFGDQHRLVDVIESADEDFSRQLLATLEEQSQQTSAKD